MAKCAYLYYYTNQFEPIKTRTYQLFEWALFVFSDYIAQPILIGQYIGEVC